VYPKPLGWQFFGGRDPFAEMDRMFAEMHGQQGQQSRHNATQLEHLGWVKAIQNHSKPFKIYEFAI
jgi:hypothetical protein